MAVLGADGAITVTQLLVAGPTILATITGYLAYKATKKRDDTTVMQADRKVALDEFNAINAMKQKIVDDLRTDLAEKEAELVASLGREEALAKDLDRVQRRCDEQQYAYQARIFELQRENERLKSEGPKP